MPIILCQELRDVCHPLFHLVVQLELKLQPEKKPNKLVNTHMAIQYLGYVSFLLQPIFFLITLEVSNKDPSD